MRRVWPWMAVAVPALAAVAAIPALRELGASGPETPLGEVMRQDFVRTVEAEGNLDAAEATVLAAPMDIELPLKVAWLAEDGSFVRAGEVVSRFDPSDMEKDLADGQADRESADSKIEKTRVTGDSTVQNLERDAAMARHELEVAREFQSKDAEIFSRTEIVQSQIDERLAVARERHASDLREIQGDLSRVNIDLLEIEKRKAQLKIDRAREGLESLELTAPHDGIFVVQETWQGPLQVGASVFRGNPVGEIPRLDEMEARIYVLEADAGGLAAGLPATVILEAHPDLRFAAEVAHVDTLPNRRLHNSPVQYFAATLTLERTDPALMKPGQRVRATLRMDERPDALTVPREAVFERDGKTVAWRLRGGRFEQVEVTLGPAALGRVVVETGLAEGDRVALRDPTRPVQPEQPREDEAPDNGTPAAGSIG